MNDPFITALNTQKAALGWFNAISENMGQLYTPGYRESVVTFADFMNGVQMNDVGRKTEQGKAMPGKGPSNLFIEGDGYFVVRKKDGTVRYTRMGDFKFNAEGTLVNEEESKVQGYLLGEDGQVIDTGDSASVGAGNNPTHSQGGPGHIPTTEINLWVDPSNGKFFGKYDEYKVRSDGVVVGVANKGKDTTPLYKIAMVKFVNAGALAQVEDMMFTPTKLSGEPMESDGEIRSGLLEKSNVDLKDQVNYLRMAKLQLDVTAKLISTNKTLLEESLRLIQ
ncbi:MAG: flagellar hook-basal body complex protein [Candidatus Melainabacteria bacterium]|nr:flagellar hook-basal body complex protein [Candidatus Melainabacteria bacterium]